MSMKSAEEYVGNIIESLHYVAPGSQLEADVLTQVINKVKQDTLRHTAELCEEQRRYYAKTYHKGCMACSKAITAEAAKLEQEKA